MVYSIVQVCSCGTSSGGSRAGGVEGSRWSCEVCKSGARAGPKGARKTPEGAVFLTLILFCEKVKGLLRGPGEGGETSVQGAI